MDGSATVSTSPDGAWIFVTVAPEGAGQSLRAAFVIQVDTEALRSERPNIAGTAKLSSSPHMMALQLSGKQTWLFAVGRYEGELPPSAQLIPAIGIATYHVSSMGSGRSARVETNPATHEEFVRSLSLKTCNASYAEKQAATQGTR